MLVLSRRSDQAVVIGGSDPLERILKVIVLEIKGESVRLGFEANKDLAVHREEVWERIRADGRLSRPSERPATGNEELERWVDDGGRPKLARNGRVKPIAE